MPRHLPLLLSAVLLLAGCGEAKQRAAKPAEPDAAVIEALADPIMTDPDLTWQNQAHAAIAVAGPAAGALPPIDRGDAAIGAARDMAARLVGGDFGGEVPPAPDPVAGDLVALRDAVTAAQMAVAAGVTRAECARDVGYSASWAARLPAPLQVYPRGAVQEAAGSDADGCGLRVVHFATPVAVADVVAFYHARLRAAGYPAAHLADHDDHALRGRKGDLAYVIHVRAGANDLTEADIVVSGV
jgi:hypothetical protein